MIKHRETARLVLKEMFNAGSIAFTCAGIIVWVLGEGILGPKAGTFVARYFEVLNPYSPYLAVALIMASIYLGAHRAISKERFAADSHLQRISVLEQEREPRLVVTHNPACQWCLDDLSGNRRVLRISVRNPGLPAIHNPLVSVRLDPDSDRMGEQALRRSGPGQEWIIRHSVQHGGNEDHVNLIICAWDTRPLRLQIEGLFAPLVVQAINYVVTISARADGIAEVVARFNLVYDAEGRPILQNA
jgi:hypothetical protein